MGRLPLKDFEQGILAEVHGSSLHGSKVELGNRSASGSGR